MQSNLRPVRLALLSLLIAGASFVLVRPAIVVAAGPDKAIAQSGDKLAANKKLVLDFFRVVFEAQNAAAAKDYLAEDYIQHNPKVPTGRAGFVNYFGPKWKAPKPVKPELADKPIEVIAEGDFVSLMWKYEKEEPADKKKKYTAFWFDMFRIKDGKIAEHWDNALK